MRFAWRLRPIRRKVDRAGGPQPIASLLADSSARRASQSGLLLVLAHRLGIWLLMLTVMVPNVLRGNRAMEELHKRIIDVVCYLQGQEYGSAGERKGPR